MNPYSHFLKTFAFTVLLFSPLVILVNAWIDPYGILGSWQVKGINEQKPQVEHHQRLVQAIAISREKPKILLMGSSRTRAGMLPENGFNLGLSAVTMEEIYAYLEHALFHQPELKEVMIDLDLFMFNRNRKLNIEFDSSRLKKMGITFDDYIGSLFTFSTLLNSFLTVQHNASNFLFPKERMPYQSPSEEDWKFIKDITLAHAWFGKFEIDPRQVAFFTKIVELCRENRIGLKFYFSPAQDIYWETIYQKGLWPVFDDLKRELCQIHPLMDFSGYNLVTTRDCEKPGEPLYTDCSHYTPIVGEWILARLNQGKPVFGYWMAPDLVEENLQKLHVEREKWSQNHQELIEAISRIAHNKTLKF